ncbi:hypothetical protein V5O48_010881 [Marasmius crinis-equi]|uniref:F-box domain-containing protein n=1 Tax=Marasmius crinis-equi TaxID=585013 RepID=A0ABR3F791_9AGAR
MPSLDGLSVELLSEILRLIHDSSRQTIFSLLRVNRAISEAALPFVYRECTFDFSQRSLHSSDRRPTLETPYQRSLEKLASLLKLYPIPDSAIWRGVRKVVVRSDWVVWEGNSNMYRSEGPPFIPSEELVRAKWGSFIEFLSRVVYLREVVFDCLERVPIILLNTLKKHPACRLHVRNWTRLGCGVKVGDPYEEALARSPCLRSIEARFVTGGPQMDLNQAAFERILAMSPNLETISYTTRSAGGCVIYPITPARLAETEKEREELAVAHPVRKSSLKNIQWGGLSPGLLRRWGSFIKLSNVESLDLGGIGDTALMNYVREHGTFSGLKHLSFQISHYPRNASVTAEEFKSALEDFLSYTCPLLQSLSIVDCNSHIDIDLSPILLRHGETLRSLAFHQLEHTGGARSILTREELTLVREKAPHLERFELDVNRTMYPGSKESEYYSVLASFPNLRHLAIYLDLGIHYKAFQSNGSSQTKADKREADRFRQIYTEIDEEFAREVWRAVRGKELEEMVLYDGEPSRDIGFGYPAGWVLREQRDRQQFVVKRNERDDLKDNVAAATATHRGRARQMLPPMISVPSFLSNLNQ